MTARSVTEHGLRPWHLRVLGGLAIEPAGTDDYRRRRLELMVHRRLTLVLLALLATAGAAGLLREQLVELMWADGDTARNRNALAQLLFRTRRALGADAVTGRRTLRLNERVISSDVAAFRRAFEAGHLADAVARYAGPLLESEHLSDTPALECWVAVERARLGEAYQRALERTNGRLNRRSPNVHPARARPLAGYARKAAAFFVALSSAVMLACGRDRSARPAPSGSR